MFQKNDRAEKIGESVIRLQAEIEELEVEIDKKELEAENLIAEGGDADKLLVEVGTLRLKAKLTKRALGKTAIAQGIAAAHEKKTKTLKEIAKVEKETDGILDDLEGKKKSLLKTALAFCKNAMSFDERIRDISVPGYELDGNAYGTPNLSADLLLRIFARVGDVGYDLRDNVEAAVRDIDRNLDGARTGIKARFEELKAAADEAMEAEIKAKAKSEMEPEVEAETETEVEPSPQPPAPERKRVYAPSIRTAWGIEQEKKYKAKVRATIEKNKQLKEAQKNRVRIIDGMTEDEYRQRKREAPEKRQKEKNKAKRRTGPDFEAEDAEADAGGSLADRYAPLNPGAKYFNRNS